MCCTMISESIFAGVVLKISGSATLGLALNLLLLYTTIAGQSCSSERAFSSDATRTRTLVVPVSTKPLNTPPRGGAEMGTMLRNALIWEAGTALAYPPSFRDVFHQGSQCLSLSWRLKTASKPGLEAPESWLEEVFWLLPWESKL